MSIIYGNVKPTFMEIYPAWGSIEKSVLKAGTPLNAAGEISNDEEAIGLVAEDTGETDNPIGIIVSGMIDLDAVEDSYGELTDACVTALKSIAFLRDGVIVASGGLPDASEASVGDVLTLDEDKAPAWSAPSGGGGGLLILDGSNTTPISDYLAEHQLPADNLYVYFDDLNQWEALYDEYTQIYVYDGDPADLVTHNIMIGNFGSGPSPK